MKLYVDPVSTTCRPVLLLMAESGAPYELEFVDLSSGAHMRPDYVAVNPSRAVPALQDDDLLLTESSAILKYIADKIDSPTYPKDPKKRARVNAMMDWLNTGFYRDFGYGFVYQQIHPHLKHADETIQKAMVDAARARAHKWLTILDKDILGTKNTYLMGDQITIADYFGACLLSIADIVRCDLAKWPNVQRWVKTMRALPSWEKVNEDFNKKFVAAFKGVPFAIL